ncbi:MAG: 3-keto-disaccharide hydrolase [Bryobacteraceae bacterium]
MRPGSIATIAIWLLTSGLALAADWKPLFNGKDLDGWKMVGPGRFVVDDGMMKTEGGMGLLYYAGEKFGNCTIRVVFKVDGARGNSGVYVRLPEQPKDPWYAVHNGYEVQIESGGDEWHTTGSLYSLSKVSEKRQKPPGEWNTMDITFRGQKTIVELNGAKVNEFDGGQAAPDRKQWFEPVRGPRPDSGYIGLQNHDARSIVYFKEVSVKR